MFKSSKVQIELLNSFEPSKLAERFQILTPEVVSERRFEPFELFLLFLDNPFLNHDVCPFFQQINVFLILKGCSKNAFR